MKRTHLSQAVLALALVGLAGAPDAQMRARDPGPRTGSPDAGNPLPGLTAGQLAMFQAGKDDFEEVEGVGDGLGPRFNLDGCAACHSQPAVGGTTTSPGGASSITRGRSLFLSSVTRRRSPPGAPPWRP